MNMNNFVPGDVVMLKSGGPRLTVFDVGTYGGESKVKCQWFAGDKFDERREDVFIEEPNLCYYVDIKLSLQDKVLKGRGCLWLYVKKSLKK